MSSTKPNNNNNTGNSDLTEQKGYLFFPAFDENGNIQPPYAMRWQTPVFTLETLTTIIRNERKLSSNDVDTDNVVKHSLKNIFAIILSLKSGPAKTNKHFISFQNALCKDLSVADQLILKDTLQTIYEKIDTNNITVYNKQADNFVSITIPQLPPTPPTINNTFVDASNNDETLSDNITKQVNILGNLVVEYISDNEDENHVEAHQHAGKITPSGSQTELTAEPAKETTASQNVISNNNFRNTFNQQILSHEPTQPNKSIAAPTAQDNNISAVDIELQFSVDGVRSNHLNNTYSTIHKHTTTAPFPRIQQKEFIDRRNLQFIPYRQFDRTSTPPQEATVATEKATTDIKISDILQQKTIPIIQSPNSLQKLSLNERYVFSNNQSQRKTVDFSESLENIKHQSKQLIDDCNSDALKIIFQSLLIQYYQTRQDEKVLYLKTFLGYHFGYPKNAKLAAAQALFSELDKVKDKGVQSLKLDTLYEDHPALLQGRLGEVAHLMRHIADEILRTSYRTVFRI